jgi:hypothetical protein
MAGATGAPRPTLVNPAGGVSAREHDTSMATSSAAGAPRRHLQAFICGIGADHMMKLRPRMV